MEIPRRSSLLAGFGVVVLLGTVLLGPVTAAPNDPGSGLVAAAGASAPTDADVNASANGTVVGVQGVGSYHDGGRVVGLDDGRVAWSENSSETYFDVTRLDNGSILAGFMQGGYGQCGDYEAPCARTGFRIVDPDPEPRVVAEWSFPVKTRTNSEVHDVEPLPGGGVVLADMDAERVVIVEGGEVVWEWRAETRYDPPADPTTTDWLHINDVDRIGDGRFLVSVRNANQLLVLDREEGVVDVVNEDGDESLLNHQHNPQWLGEGAVLVADSENHRVVELHETADGDWEPAWILASADGTRFNWPRDADRLPNGNTLITDTRNARVVEVTEDGTVVDSHQFDYRFLPYEADRGGREPVGGPLYGVDARTDADPGTDAGSESDAGTDAGPTATVPDDPVVNPSADAGAIPVLTPAYRLVSAAAPLPLWFGEWHLLTAVVGLVCVAGGAVARRRGH